MSAGHDYLAPHVGHAGARHRGRLLVAFFLTLGFFVVELAGAFFTDSLALLSDAGHMLTDVGGLGMALAAITLASRGSDHPSRTFGLYRLEIFAALVNAGFLFAVALYVLYESIRRLQEPSAVLGVPMLVIAVVGLLVNLLAFAILRQGAQESLNVRGAYLEVLSDALGSLGVIVAGVTLQLTGWTWVDPVAGAAIGLFILPRSGRLAMQALRILLQAAPAHIDVRALGSDLAHLPGVLDVHDLHVWTLTSEMDVASAHIRIADTVDSHGVLDRARDLLRERYGVEHATLQVEPEGHSGCEEMRW